MNNGTDTPFTPEQLLSGRRLTFKGAPEVLQLFRFLVDQWYTVGDVANILRAQGVLVHRNTVRLGLNQMVDMGFLEKSSDARVEGAKARYRRCLTQDQRDFRDRLRKKARARLTRDRVGDRAVDRRERERERAASALQDF